MKLPIFMSILWTAHGFAPVYRNNIGLTSFPSTGIIKNNRCNQLPFVLCALRDDTSEQTARSLFDAYSSEGSMDLSAVKDVPFVKELLSEGDLLETELKEIYSAAASGGTIDINGFVAVYKDIDNLFEEEDEEEDAISTDDTDDSDLKDSFVKLATDGLVSKSALRQWEEITSLIDEEGMLGADEFEDLWKNAVDGAEMMNLKSFVTFNEALDDLFVLEDDELDEAIENNDDEEEIPVLEATAKPRPIITETDLPPAVLFSQLADENYLVSKQDIVTRWGEMREMLKDGDLTDVELDELWNGVAKAPGTNDKLDEEGFSMLYDKIDELFEDEDDQPSTTNAPVGKEAVLKEPEQDLKEELLELIQDLDNLGEKEGRQPCGLDCTELEQERVLEVVSELEREQYNRVSGAGGGSNVVPKEDLVGNWDLIYSSSSTMKYNEGLSGLAGGLTKFGGVQQRLSATKYLSDVEYVEQVVGKLGGQSFEVRITGDWDLRTEVSLFTGKPSNVLSVTPDAVKWGPRSDKADHWKSLGPMNLLVLSYLDDDLRIMRGNTSTDTLFIFRRCK